MRSIPVLLTMLLLSACLTINVYFPAAETEAAAREFVEKVIGDAPAGEPTSALPPARSDRVARILGFFIADAHAQEADINLKTPAILAIQARMTERFQAQLAAGFDAGALGFGADGLVVLRDAAKVPLKTRAALTQAVADDNRDRNVLYREIAVANGHAEWEARIREIFARQWIAQARPGWWYQTTDGAWQQK